MSKTLFACLLSLAAATSLSARAARRINVDGRGLLLAGGDNVGTRVDKACARG